MTKLILTALIIAVQSNQKKCILEEEILNLYCCGHYASEAFGINTLAEEVAKDSTKPGNPSQRIAHFRRLAIRQEFIQTHS
jgi:hypothetical protein